VPFNIHIDDIRFLNRKDRKAAAFLYLDTPVRDDEPGPVSLEGDPLEFFPLVVFEDVVRMPGRDDRAVVGKGGETLE